MKILIDVADFGEIIVSDSPDNSDCVRLEMREPDWTDERHFDLTADEVDELVAALDAVKERIRWLHR